jgi:hypothetical protein
LTAERVLFVSGSTADYREIVRDGRRENDRVWLAVGTERHTDDAFQPGFLNRMNYFTENFVYKKLVTGVY